MHVLDLFLCIYVSSHVCKYMHIYVHTYAHIYAHIYANVYTYIYTTFMCDVFVRVNICIITLTYIRRRLSVAVLFHGWIDRLV